MKKTKPVISVVIPAYNEEKLIKKCLSRLREQDFHLPYEIIIVNGPSVDRTRQIAAQYADLVIDQSGLGIGQARSQGCALAQGEILAITDADVVVPPNWLTRIYQYFRRHKYIIALTGPYRFVNSAKLNQQLIVRDVAFELHESLTGAVALSGTNMAVRTDAYLEVGGFDPEITGLEDVELGLRLSKIGKAVYLKNLYVETTDRRFKHPTRHVLGTLLPAYIKRTILKNKDKKVIWKPIHN